MFPIPSYIKQAMKLVLWFSITTIFTLLLTLLLQNWSIIPANMKEIYPRHFFILLLLELVIFFLAFQYLPIHKKISIPFAAPKHHTKDIIYLIIGYAIVLVASTLVNAIIGVGDIQTRDFNKENILSEVLLFFIITVVIAPIFEEYIFRGILLGFLIPNDNQHQPILNLRKCITLVFSNYQYMFALVFSSALFAMVHGYIELIPALTLFGFYLGMVFIYFGSLQYCIAIHALHNCLAFLLYMSS